jgi:hypothetical protein
MCLIAWPFPAQKTVNCPSRIRAETGNKHVDRVSRPGFPRVSANLGAVHQWCVTEVKASLEGADIRCEVVDTVSSARPAKVGVSARRSSTQLGRSQPIAPHHQGNPPVSHLGATRLHLSPPHRSTQAGVSNVSIFEQVTRIVVDDGKKRKPGLRVRLVQTSRIPPEFCLSDDPAGGYTFLESAPLKIRGLKLMRVQLLPGPAVPRS